MKKQSEKKEQIKLIESIIKKIELIQEDLIKIIDKYEDKRFY